MKSRGSRHGSCLGRLVPECGWTAIPHRPGAPTLARCAPPTALDHRTGTASRETQQRRDTFRMRKIILGIVAATAVAAPLATAGAAHADNNKGGHIEVIASVTATPQDGGNVWSH